MLRMIGLSFVLFLAPLVAEETELKKYDEWRAALGSEIFAKRQLATKEIWKGGRESLGFLEELLADENPELRARALTIIQKVKLGITPETPEKVTQLLDQYFSGTAKRKLSVIGSLQAAREYELLLRLREFERDVTVLEKLDPVIAEILPGVVRSHLNEGDLQSAKQDLALSDQFDHLIQYAHLLEVMGELDAEIQNLSQLKDLASQARYLACLRVKGDAELLRAAAQKLGDQDAENLAALNLGDHLPFLRSVLEESNPTLPNRYYIQWAIADHEGDEAVKKEVLDALLYLSGQESERQGARMSLFRMGYGEHVFQGLQGSELDGKVAYLLSHDRYAEAQEVIGLRLGEDLDESLGEILKKAEVAVEESGNSGELDRLVHIVNFLEERGLVKNAVQVSLVLFDLLRPLDDWSTAGFARKMYYSAPVSVFTALAREVTEYGVTLEEFFDLLPLRTPDKSLLLLDTLAEIYPEMEFRERLLLAMSFSSRELLVSPEIFREARDKVFAFFRGREDEVEQLKNLRSLLAERNREEDLLMLTAALAEAGSPDYFIESSLAVDGGQIKKGGEALAKMKIKDGQVSANFLYKKGLILKRAGMEGGEEVMKKALLFSNGSALSLTNFAMEHLRLGEVSEAYGLLRRALLRTESPVRSSQLGIRHSIVEELAAEAVTLGHWENALAYRELAALGDVYATGDVPYGIFAMRLRFQILIARGAVAMKRGDVVEAVKAFTRAHEILPRDGYLANDFFPLLRSLGLIELHDQLFAKSIQFCRESIHRYPKDDNAYNNFAWMASRANRCLDEAEGYLKIALSLNPESAAYLDTMGEIYFARRKREEAVKWSVRSVANSVLGSVGTRWELQYQNERFRLGGFPPE